MAYVDGFLVAVPTENKQAYVELCAKAAKKFKELGAIDYVECWGEDVPEGAVTSFPMAVKREADETVVFSWVIWPDKDARNKAWEAMMKDEDMPGPADMPFDGKRMIYGGFSPIFGLDA
ncbi:DUF1428 domain-containing protein [Martelella endophytica]|uniref:RNA signal recognition particle 4.5S RNA n=1 Tax=Martelella endophytica TaxID=1486262 RepID=A0A0D5LUW6_MAREN|nr:DUF1428 domain-containing protein [Martelella endophytica]AJY47557.1 RNA signal recognition particle 4.5S RNA [Martelella endophytica]